MTKTLLFLLLILFTSATITAQGIKGTVFDKKTGETIIGATLVFSGTTNGTVTDFDGKYTLKAAPATYDIQVSFVSYETQTIKNVEIKSNEITILNIQLGEANVQLDEIIITAKENKRSETSIMLLQRKSAKIIDGISAEQMSKLGDDNAASALKRVTGVSVQSGKYVFIRGLGDRYTKTTLNSAEIPGLDPEKNSVQMDLFPSNVIDNILVTKTFTPDMPGESTGGQVNIITRDFPDQFTIHFSASFKYNTQSSLNSNFISRTSGKYDWLGMDGGYRQSSEESRMWINSMEERGADQIIFPYYNANEMGEFTNSFNLDVVPITKKSFIDQTYQLSVGNLVNLKKQRLIGYNFALSYSKKYKYFNDGEIGLWQDEIPSSTKVVADERGEESVTLSSLFNINYKLNNNHKIGMRLMRNQAGSKVGRYREGLFNYESPETYIQERSISYLERNFTTAQLHGKHVLNSMNSMVINWLSSFTYMQQNEPDAIFFKNLYEYDTQGVAQFRFKTNELPNRIYRDMGEVNFDNKIDVELPVNLFSKQDKFKFGTSYLFKNRSANQEKIELRLDNVPYHGNFELDGNIPELIANNVISDTNPLGLFYTMDMENNKLNSYQASSQFLGVYFLADFLIGDKFRVLAGARYEGSNMKVKNKSSISPKEGNLIKHDILPSLNLTYHLLEKMNLRFAYSQTIARPQFREFAPQSFYDYKLGMRLNGNPELKRSSIKNIDLRWEYYFNRGEMFAISGFHKSFTDAIEQRLDPGTQNFEITYINTPKAILYGIEIELRKNLGFIDILKDFSLGGNFTMVKSSIELTETEQLLRGTKTRTMVGQAPYVFNTYFSYTNSPTKLSVNVGFNISGDKLVLITAQATPYVFEKPRPDLTFNVSKGFGEKISIEFSADNILNSNFKTVYPYSEEYGGERISISYSEGITFGMKIKYLIN